MTDWTSPPDFEQPAYRAFEAYGYAMAAASVFEILLRLVLAKSKAPTLDRIEDRDKRERETLKFSRKVIFQATCGNLVQWVLDQNQFDEELAAALRQARDSRDYLAHHFWQVHLGNLGSEEGIDLIALECNLIGQFFNDVGDRLVRETGVDTSGYKAFVQEQSAAARQEHPFADLIVAPEPGEA